MTYHRLKIWLKYVLSILPVVLIMLIIYKYYIPGVILGVVLLILSSYYLRISRIIETTLCLIVKDNKVLMMLRNKKHNDVHLNKYNGLGGKVEDHESKTQCVLREVYEEAGIILTEYQYVGKVIFKNFGNQIGKEIMYCYVGYEYQNEIGDCNEGELEWIPKDKVMSLPLWEGDKYFLMNIINNEPFKAFLHYEGSKVVGHKIKLKGD